MSSADLFKKFTMETISQLAATKASDQRRIRATLAHEFPSLSEEHWELIMPKKEDIMYVKCHDAVALVTTVGPRPKVLFFHHHEGPFLPHLRVLHMFPWILPHHQVDAGGCKFVVSGANVMCPGLTSPGGRVEPNIARGAPVAIKIEGKQHAVAVGFALMSSVEIAKVNKGHCVENVHHLGDGLWMLHELHSG